MAKHRIFYIEKQGEEVRGKGIIELPFSDSQEVVTEEEYNAVELPTFEEEATEE